MLQGNQGRAAKKSMEILAALGEIYGAKRLIPVTSVQVSGVSFDNLGEAGLEFLSEMAEDGEVKVLTTLNPAGMDVENWRTEPVDFIEDFHLMTGSGCIDAGDPDVSYNDTDGSRNDMGTYGGPGAE